MLYHSSVKIRHKNFVRGSTYLAKITYTIIFLQFEVLLDEAKYLLVHVILYIMLPLCQRNKEQMHKLFVASDQSQFHV